MYGVFNGTHYNNRCCFDYGNAETNNLDDGAGTMEAIYFGNAKGGLNHGGAGKGPWIMADMENALWGADVVESNEAPINHSFVTAMVKGDSSGRRGPPGPYTPGVDYGGNDMAPCNFNGCVLPRFASHLDCESKCNATTGCVGYVFADSSCSGASGPICWTKSRMEGSGTRHECRDSRILAGFPGHWAIKGGDAQTGKLSVYWDGKRAPGYVAFALLASFCLSNTSFFVSYFCDSYVSCCLMHICNSLATHRYAPMKKQGAIILGIGGDNSDGAVGTFYEGAMTQGYSSDATDDAVQANIVAAGYGR